MDPTNPFLSPEEALALYGVAEMGITETMWPQLRDILLQDPSGMDRLNLRCIACNQRMTVGNDNSQHAACILPCGHMIGYKCCRSLYSEKPRASTHTCPACSYDLIHPGCGHPHYGVLMHSSVDSFHLTPPTLPEGGGCLHRTCPDCSVEKLLEGLLDIYSSMNDDPSVWRRVDEGKVIRLLVYDDPNFRLEPTFSSPPIHLKGVQMHRDKDLQMPQWMRDIGETVLERFMLQMVNAWQSERFYKLRLKMVLEQEQAARKDAASFQPGAPGGEPDVQPQPQTTLDVDEQPQSHPTLETDEPAPRARRQSIVRRLFTRKH
ncbi:hypothetical protein FDECE_1962 [Fusarium decemcellulare]|nr:hypothetical protein FDECE_1962 [Fusarium decemcellulare]